MEAIITNIIWIKIEPILPVKATKVGRPKTNPRLVLKAVMLKYEQEHSGAIYHVNLVQSRRYMEYLWNGVDQVLRG